MIIKLNGHEVAYAYGYLSNAEAISGDKPVSHPVDHNDQVLLQEALDVIDGVCKRIELDVTLAQLPRVRKVLADAKTYGDLREEFKAFRLRMHDELKSRLFLFIPPIEAKFYGKKEPFGPLVARKFARAISDIEEAGNCIAVGRSTAAVFHLMRVMERGVQGFGKRLGVKLADEKNWQNILDEINKAVKALPETTSKLKTYKSKLAGVSAHLYNVKLAWRNPVMHPKVSYSPEESADIYDHVRVFMEHLVETI
jgi:hypothetical protein